MTTHVTWHENSNVTGVNFLFFRLLTVHDDDDDDQLYLMYTRYLCASMADMLGYSTVYLVFVLPGSNLVKKIIRSKICFLLCVEK